MGGRKRRLTIGSDTVPQTPVGGLGAGDHTAGEQEIVGPSDADEARQDPAHRELGGEPELRCGRGDFRPGGDEAQVAVERKRQADTGARPVDRGDDRQAVAELPDHVGVEPVAAAGLSRIRWQSAVVRPVPRGPRARQSPPTENAGVYR